MTRINCVPPSELVDLHLLAEYRELPRVFNLAVPSVDIPKKYVLGTGHVRFFYNKLQFLYDRQWDIYKEMRRRGMNPRHHPDGLLGLGPRACWGDWEPTQEAIVLNRMRIKERLKEIGL